MASADPVYMVGVPIPLHQQSAVALDQLCQRHLAPMESPTPAQVRRITGCAASPLGPPPCATVTKIRAILHRASATVPYHDVPEYKLYN